MRVGSPYRTKSTQSELAHVPYLCRRSDRACLTKTHKRLAVVYQPATFVEMRHDPGLMLAKQSAGVNKVEAKANI